jgi:hypothetical protein
MDFAIEQVQNILTMVNPMKKWTIKFQKLDNENIHDFSDWDRKYYGLHTGDESFLIFDEEDHLLYVVNVTGDSIITAVYELMSKLSCKF